jgi:hypothetical protein
MSLGGEREREGVSFTLKSSQLKKQQYSIVEHVQLTRTKKYPTFLSFFLMSLCILYMFWILKIDLWYLHHIHMSSNLDSKMLTFFCLFLYLVFSMKNRHVSIYCSGHPCVFSSAGNNLGLFQTY